MKNMFYAVLAIASLFSAPALADDSATIEECRTLDLYCSTIWLDDTCIIQLNVATNRAHAFVVQQCPNGSIEYGDKTVPDSSGGESAATYNACGNVTPVRCDCEIATY